MRVPEIILFDKHPYTLDEVVKVLHYIFMNLKEKRDIVPAFSKILDSSNKEEVEKIFLDLFNKEKEKIDEGKRRHITLNPMKIFLGTLTPLLPYMGDIDTGGDLKNKGFVLGLEGTFISEKGDEYQIYYHVDYDPTKKLHINFILGKDKQVNICLKLPNHSKRFGCTMELSKDEKAQIIQYKFWIKMTLGYRSYNSLMGENSSIIPPQDKEKIAAFLRDDGISLETVKESLTFLTFDLEEEQEQTRLQSLIDECKTKSEICEKMFSEPWLRTNVIDTGVRVFMPKHKTHRAKFSENSESVDSEKSSSSSSHSRSDSHSIRRKNHLKGKQVLKGSWGDQSQSNSTPSQSVHYVPKLKRTQ